MLSSSLDDLDVDNGDERISNRSHNCYPSMSFNSSATLDNRDGLGSSETTTELDFNMSRAESLPLSSNLQSKVFACFPTKLVTHLFYFQLAKSITFRRGTTFL